MIFIFPQNYNFKPKLFGIIEYSTAIFNISWLTIIWLLCSLLTIGLKAKILIVILLCLPLLIFSIVGLNGENILYVIKYILKYLFNPKVYVFGKAYRKIS